MNVYTSWNVNRNLFLLPHSKKICWGQGCISLLLFQSFVFEFCMLKLYAHKKLDLLFCLKIVSPLHFCSIAFKPK